MLSFLLRRQRRVEMVVSPPHRDVSHEIQLPGTAETAPGATQAVGAQEYFVAAA